MGPHQPSLEPLLFAEGGKDQYDRPVKRSTTRRVMLVGIAIFAFAAVYFVSVSKPRISFHTDVRAQQSQMKLREVIARANLLDSYLPESARGHQFADGVENAWTGKTAMPVQLPYVVPESLLTQPVNDTLGFGAIFPLNLDYRTDKKDEIDLIGAVTGLKFETLPGVNMDKVNRKGIPWVHPKLSKGEIGCYLSHVGAYRKIVERGLKAALVLEDDFNVDLNIRTGVRALQQAIAVLMASISGTPRQFTSVDPWMSDDWDLIFLGHCGDDFYTQKMSFEKDSKLKVDPNHYPLVIYQDPTVLDMKHPQDYGWFTASGYSDYITDLRNTSRLDESQYPRHRLIAVGHRPICATAYAVSQRGARKLLYHMTRSVESQIDVELSILCGKGELLCLAPHPPMFSQWKIADGANSDIHFDEVEAKEGKAQKLKHFNPSIGRGQHVRNSAREHLGELIYAKQQYQ